MALGRRRSPVDPRKAGSVEAALRRALRAAVAEDWETAESWLERIVESDSADLDAYHALARLYRERGDIGRAIRMHQNLLLRTGLDKREKHEALLELARDFDRGGFAERAAAAYEEVIDGRPREEEALERLVALHGTLRDYPRALSLLKRWRRSNRSAADAAEREILIEQARAQADEGDADGARASLKRALRRNRANAEALSMMGDLEAEKGRDARAVDAWRKAVLADPALGDALLPKIEAGYAARKKPREFEKLLRQILAENPAQAAANRALARSLAARGQLREAIEVLGRAIEIAPSEVLLRVELGRMLMDSGQDAEALKSFVALLQVVEREALDTVRDRGPS